MSYFEGRTVFVPCEVCGKSSPAVRGGIKDQRGHVISRDVENTVCSSCLLEKNLQRRKT